MNQNRVFRGALEYKFGVKAFALVDLGLRDAKDMEIYRTAKEQNAIIVTKDRDFLELYFRFGSPPKVIILNCGNLTNIFLQNYLLNTLPKALKILENENIVEIG